MEREDIEKDIYLPPIDASPTRNSFEDVSTIKNQS